MTDPTVTQPEPADQPDPFAEIAAALYRIADGIVSLTGSGTPEPTYIQLTVMPSTGRNDDLTQQGVDAMTSAVLGHPGQVEAMGNGDYHYSNGEGAERVGPVGVRIMRAVSTEWALKNDVAAAEAELAEREAEAEKARARVAELRGLSYSREPESTVVTPVPADVEGHAEFSPRGDRSVPLIGRVQAETLTGARSAASEVPKHFETRGWNGGPGNCGVECACGIGFGGFDSLTEAGAVLDEHIAESNDPRDEDNQRAKAAVVADLRPGEHARIANPGLAQFLAGKEHKRREAAGLRQPATGRGPCDHSFRLIDDLFVCACGETKPIDA